MKFEILPIIVLVLESLTACSFATYEDGQIQASGFAIGENKALDGLQYMKNKDGTQFQIRGLESNQTEGLAQLNQLVKSIVQGAVAGMKP